jgi:hypothetical protein
MAATISPNRDEGDGHRQPQRHTPPAQDPGQRMHSDDEDEREQDGCEDRGELLQRQDRDEQPGHAEHHDQTARQQPAGHGVSGVDHTMTLPPGGRAASPTAGDR